MFRLSNNFFKKFQAISEERTDQLLILQPGLGIGVGLWQQKTGVAFAGWYVWYMVYFQAVMVPGERSAGTGRMGMALLLSSFILYVNMV